MYRCDVKVVYNSKFFLIHPLTKEIRDIVVVGTYSESGQKFRTTLEKRRSDVVGVDEPPTSSPYESTQEPRMRFPFGKQMNERKRVRTKTEKRNPKQ